MVAMGVVGVGRARLTRWLPGGVSARKLRQFRLAGGAAPPRGRSRSEKVEQLLKPAVADRGAMVADLHPAFEEPGNRDHSIPRDEFHGPVPMGCRPATRRACWMTLAA